MTDDWADNHAISEAFRQDMENKLEAIVADRKRGRMRKAEKRVMYAPWGGLFELQEPEEQEVFAVYETASA